VNFSSSGSGMSSSPATFITGPSNSYVFKLYDYSSGSRGATLATTTVTGKYSPTFSITDMTRSTVTNFVVGDTWYLNVTDAPASATVQIQWTSSQGLGSSTYNAGNTDAYGNFSTSSGVLSGSIGRWTGQGLVAGVAAGDPFTTEIIAQPTGIYLFSVPSGVNCAPTSYQPYGFAMQNVSWGVLGLVYGFYDIDITAHIYQQYPGYSGAYADATVAQGLVPYFIDPWDTGDGSGWCGTAAFSGFTWVQTFDMKIGGLDGSDIRTNYWVENSPSPHAGEIKNNDDVDLVFP